MLAIVLCSGCSEMLDTSYGHSGGESLNGTGALAELFREDGCEVRTAVRMTDELKAWADVIVRFAPYPGPVELEESRWYETWLNRKPERALIYVARDYDAEDDYWNRVLAELPKDTPAKKRSRIEARRRDKPFRELTKPREHQKEVGDPSDWFTMNPATNPATTCKKLDGPWAQGVDAAKAAVAEHETLKVDVETVLLGSGPKKAIAMEWTRANDSRVLVIANGSFLLNAALLIPERRPLAHKVVEWTDGEGLHVAFLEGSNVIKPPPPSPSIWSILERVRSIRWVMIQMLVLGLAVCLWKAPRLGSPRQEADSDADRPAAHPEALGTLLARAGRAQEARTILDTYRRWRNPSRYNAPPAPTPGSSLPAPNNPTTAKPNPDRTSEIEFLDT